MIGRTGLVARGLARTQQRSFSSSLRRLRDVRPSPMDPPAARGPSAGARWQVPLRTVFLACTLSGFGMYMFGMSLGLSRSAEASGSSTAPLRDADAARASYGDRKAVLHVYAELQKILGEEGVTMDEEVLDAHGASDWSSHGARDNPIAVAYPTSTEQVSEIAKLCHRYRIPIVPYSGGTSLEGHFNATNGGICLDFTMMDHVLEVHPEDLDAIVQPGVGWQDLNLALKPYGLFFAPDPGPGAKIGGMVGTGCSGTNAAHFGTMRENVIHVTAVLADGTIVKTRRRPRKSSAGYDLTRLFIGSEGTLGIITEIAVKLNVIAKVNSVASCHFPSIRDAAATVSEVMGLGVPVAAIEIMDEKQMAIINATNETGRKWPERPSLFFKFAGTDGTVTETAKLVKDIAKKHSGGAFQFAKDQDEADKIWSARKVAFWSFLTLRKENEAVWTTDVAVPLSKLPDLIEISKKDLDESGFTYSILAHAGDGNFHNLLLYDKTSPEAVKKAKELVHRLVRRAIAMDGTVTGEHGVGLVKCKYLEEELGSEAVGVMRRLKTALDPYDILNPGHVLPNKS